MSTELLNWVHKCLDEDEEIIVPLKKLWRRRYNDWSGKVSFEEFARLVLADDRFEQVYSIELDARLEAFGLFAGPRVKLRSREITEEGILLLVRKHNERIAQILRHSPRSIFELLEQE